MPKKLQMLQELLIGFFREAILTIIIGKIR